MFVLEPAPVSVKLCPSRQAVFPGKRGCQSSGCRRGRISVGGLCFSLFWFRDFLVDFFFYLLMWRLCWPSLVKKQLNKLKLLIIKVWRTGCGLRAM